MHRLFPCLALSLIACVPEDGLLDVAEVTRESSVSRETNLVLGQGYDTLTGAPVGSCVSMTVDGTESQSNAALIADVQVVESTTELEDALGISAKVSAGIGPFSAEARGEFARSIQFNENTVYAVVRVEATNVPTFATQVSLIDGDTFPLYLNQDRFLQRCGDSYVSSVTRGAAFYGVFMYRTSSESERQDWSASLETSFVVGSAEGSVLEGLRRFSQNKQLAIRTHLVGGSGAELNVPMQLSQFLEQASKTPERAAAHPVPVRFQIMPYTTLRTPEPEVELDRSALQRTADLVARDLSRGRECMDRYQFVLENYSEFEEPDLGELAMRRNRMGSWMTERQESLNACLTAPCSVDGCEVPACTVAASDAQTEEIYTCKEYLPRRKSGHRSITEKWLTVDGQRGILGPQLTDPAPAGFNAIFVEFAGGAIYYRPETLAPDGSVLPGSGRAYIVYRNILERWRALGAEAGPLGFPSGDTTHDGVRGRHNRFQGGLIVELNAARDSAVARPDRVVVLRQLAVTWLAAGAGGGGYGYPTEDERVSQDGARSSLSTESRARLYWTGGTVSSTWGPGAIEARYQELGGVDAWIGGPVESETGDAHGGARVVFEGGRRIYWSPATGPRLVVHGILGRYLDEGGPGGSLGYPTTDEACGQRPGGRWSCVSEFQHGAIFWSEELGTLVATPTLQILWNAAGGAAGAGWPTSTRPLPGYPGITMWTFVSPNGTSRELPTHFLFTPH